jgi:hypothetical protein
MSITLPSFPNPVDEVSARLVAGGVLLLATAFVLTGSTPLVVVLAYGFAARVLAGPRLSPLGLLVTRGLRPRLRLAPRLVPGPPKRFAQGIGALLSMLALVLAVVGAGTAARVVVALIVSAAALESLAGFCVGCAIFAVLLRRGIVPESVCEACNDVTLRARGAPPPRLDPMHPDRIEQPHTGASTTSGIASERERRM